MGSRLIIGVGVNAVVLWIIMQFSDLVAWLYLLLLVLSALLVYRVQFFNGLNNTLLALRGI